MLFKQKMIQTVLIGILILLPTLGFSNQEKTIVVGSKRFTENYIVAEIFAQLLEANNYTVERRFGLAGTMIAYSALNNGDIDVYPEYTGTLAAAILKEDLRDFDQINNKLSASQVQMLPALGFDNSYAIIMNEQLAEELKIRTLSDLSKHPKLIGALSFEFENRNDGWKSLKEIYNLTNSIQGMDIPLTYEALKNQKVEFAEAYTTEPLIKKYQFRIIEDSKAFFPKYKAIPLVRSNASQKIKDILRQLENSLDNNSIIDLNSKATNKVPIETVANNFLVDSQLIDAEKKQESLLNLDWLALWDRVLTHIYLTMLAVFLATWVAVPLAIMITSQPKLSQFILGAAGIMQTIPSIALLAFMIPFFGIGFLPAIIGLFIYSVLPILQNTFVAMKSIDPRLITAARGIGLYPMEVLFTVKLPLAFPTILAGIRTATIMNIGTATLAAFIGAGGLGEPIVTGLALNNSGMILQGAIPAALLAIFMDGLFAFINKRFSKQI